MVVHIAEFDEVLFRRVRIQCKTKSSEPEQSNISLIKDKDETTFCSFRKFNMVDLSCDENVYSSKCMHIKYIVAVFNGFSYVLEPLFYSVEYIPCNHPNMSLYRCISKSEIFAKGLLIQHWCYPVQNYFKIIEVNQSTVELDTYSMKIVWFLTTVIFTGL